VHTIIILLVVVVVVVIAIIIVVVLILVVVVVIATYCEAESLLCSISTENTAVVRILSCAGVAWHIVAVINTTQTRNACMYICMHVYMHVCIYR
jgi:uncharacterized membrane protein YqjE